MAQPKIYTKTGDLGETSLVTGLRVKKDHPRLHAYGATDELNAHLGLALSYLKEEANPKLLEVKTELKKVQEDLFVIGSLLSCDDSEILKKLPQLDKKRIESLEQSMDQMSSELPELKNFILPGGHIVSSSLHLARTVCRRTERHVVSLIEFEKDSIFTEAMVYLNRLSDYFFITSRFVNFVFSQEEVIWKG